MSDVGNSDITLYISYLLHLKHKNWRLEKLRKTVICEEHNIILEKLNMNPFPNQLGPSTRRVTIH